MFTHQQSVSLESNFPNTVEVHCTRTLGDVTEIMYSTNCQSNKLSKHEELILL